jgi:hypothetical protein
VVACFEDARHGRSDHAIHHQGAADRGPPTGAASTAKAAEARAETGNVEQGVPVALDIEQPVYEAGRLLDAASLINRPSKEE